MLAHTSVPTSIDLKRHGPAKVASLKHRLHQRQAPKLKLVKASHVTVETTNAPSFAGLAG